MTRYNGLNVDHRDIAERAAWQAWRRGHSVHAAVQHALARAGVVATEAAFVDAYASVDRRRVRPVRLVTVKAS